MKWLAARLALAAIVALVVVLPARPASADSGGGVLPPGAKPYGHTYGEWSNLWWQWFYSIPVIAGQEQLNPAFDTTGSACGVNQRGKVWFLAGIAAPLGQPLQGTLDRTQCAIPNGTALFIPILNVEDDNAPPFTDFTPEQRQATVDFYLSLMHNISATIDGQPVQNLQQYLVPATNPESTFTFPNFTPPQQNFYQYNGYGTPAGTYDMRTGGYYLLLHPLSTGQHTIRFSGAIRDPGAPGMDIFALDITYLLTVR